VDQQTDRRDDQQSDDECFSKLLMRTIVIGDQEKIEQQDSEKSLKPKPSAPPLRGFLLKAFFEFWRERQPLESESGKPLDLPIDHITLLWRIGQHSL
jgi:hypothetical protein